MFLIFRETATLISILYVLVYTSTRNDCGFLLPYILAGTRPKRNKTTAKLTANKCANEMDRQFSKEEAQMATKWFFLKVFNIFSHQRNVN